MQLSLYREPSATSCKGELFIDGVFTCYTLERPEEGSIVAIPSGTYQIELKFSPHFQRVLPHLLDVPGRTDILMHGGNKPEDSLGCILCGYKDFGPDSIGDASAVNDLVRLMEAAIAHGETVSIAVIDP
jgi:Family of unknown function (DUF5675)